jgi:hypothetical protein
MDFENAVKQVVSSVKASGIGIQFSYEDVNQWLGIASGDDLMWVYDTLSDRLMAEHAICLELREDGIITTVPDDSDIAAAKKRKS